MTEITNNKMKLQDIRWKRNIFNAIKDISDLEWQKKAWMGKHLTDVSSFDEIYMVLFDDFGFEDYFIKDETIERLGISKELGNEMKLLCTMMLDYKEKDTEEEILEDTEWHKITKQAEKVIKIWNK